MNKKEYELINLGFEYPGMTGGIRWAVVTDLDIGELEEKCKMYFLMELTVDEIAEIEGITHQKVSESIIKAKGNLEKILKKIKFF